MVSTQQAPTARRCLIVAGDEDPANVVTQSLQSTSPRRASSKAVEGIRWLLMIWKDLQRLRSLFDASAI